MVFLHKQPPNYISLDASVRIIQTIAGTRLDHGGTSRSIPALCDSLFDLGVDVHLVTAVSVDSTVRSNFPNRASVHVVTTPQYCKILRLQKRFYSILSSIDRKEEKMRLIHDHGMWLPSNHAVASYCRKNGVSRVVSPRGMLGTWAMRNGKWKKHLAWRLYQRKDLEQASAFHATSEQEASEIRSLGFQQPILVAPNGVQLPDQLPTRKRNGKRQALFLSRIHPKKGLIMLVDAWKCADVSSDWQLVIVGPSENGHKEVVESHIRKIGLADSIHFRPQVVDIEKWQLYMDSDLFILPSFNENFGIVIAEAMAAGLPTITTTGTPWECLISQKAGWWVPASVAPIANAIREAVNMSDVELTQRGANGAKWIASALSWQRTAQQFVEFYPTLLKI